MAEANSSRARFEGEHDALMGVLSKYATSPWWLKYPEDPECPIAKETIVSHALLLQDLAELAPNLSFTKTQIKAAFKAILESELATAWPLNGDEKKDWMSKMDKRLRCLLRHTAQAILKRRGSGSHWLDMVFGQKSKEGEGEIQDDDKTTKKTKKGGKEEDDTPPCKRPAAHGAAAEAAAAPLPAATTTKPFLHYERSTHQAWRAYSPKGEKEFSTAIVPQGEDHLPARAVFADGEEYDLAALLTSEVKLINARLETKRGRVAKEWQGTHHGGEELHISRKKDHKMLWCLYQDGKSICYAVAEPDAAKSLEVLKAIAILYAEGKLQRSDLKKEKDKRLKEAMVGQEASSGSKQVAKRPAASKALLAGAGAPTTPPKKQKQIQEETKADEVEVEDDLLDGDAIAILPSSGDDIDLYV